MIRSSAFLFTAIEDSPRLWEDYPEEMAGAKEHHDRVVNAAAQRRGGRVFKVVSEGVCAALPSAAEAVGAAVEAQSRFSRQAWPLPGGIRVRMAVHWGDAEERGGDYFGVALSRVARVLALCPGGQVLVTEAARREAEQDLPDEALLRDRGVHPLRGLQDPEHLFQVVHPDLPADSTPLRSPGSVPNNLVPESTSFVGREAEIADVQQMLFASRLLSLTGPAGIGKSRLASQSAAEMCDRHPGGVWVVEPAAGEPLLAAAARVLALPAAAGAQELAARLGGQPALLVFDHGEPAGAAPLAAELLHRCPGLSILWSGRAPLDLAGDELVWSVPPLACPEPGDPSPDPGRWDALRLFQERAAAAAPALGSGPGFLNCAARLCASLGGVPLAIEIVAAAVAIRPLQALAEEVESAVNAAGAVLPEEILDCVLRWRWALLEPSERVLLARLARLPGTFALEEAESRGAGGEIEDWQVLELLSRLADAGLAACSSTPGGVVYRLPNAVREFTVSAAAQSPA